MTADVAAAPHLPNPPDILLGREGELAAIAALFADPACRLVTLHGPGGVGETRLAIAAALAIDPAARFVDLAPLADAAAILPTVAAALEVSPDAAPDPLADLPAIWAGRPLDGRPAPWAGQPLLLVLDNAEHLLDGIAVVGALLDALPAARALVTCRAVTGLPGERAAAILPFPLPPEDEAFDPAAAESWAAVRLFARRAAARSRFDLTPANAADVAAICRRLDGLPLAIELAAARTAALTPAALLARLESALPLLAGGAPDLPDRHRTVRGAIAWGYGLLEPGERALLRRLAVCAGGCTPALAEGVAEGLGLDVPGCLDGLARQHFLQQRPGPDAEPRWAMLATIREFALEELAAAGEEPPARAAHAAAVTAFAAGAVPGLRGPDSARWLARLDADHDNARAAMPQAIAARPAAAVALAAAIWRYWHLRGHWAEGLHLCEAAVAAEAAAGGEAPARAGATRSAVLNGAAVLAYLRLDLPRAWSHVERAREAAVALGDERAIAETMHTIGILHWESGNDDAALAAYEDALGRLRLLGVQPDITNAINNLALLHGRQGDLPRAVALLEEALAYTRSIGDQRSEIDLLCNIGGRIEEQGDAARARAMLEEAMALARALGGDEEISQSAVHLGLVHEHLGDLAGARRLLEEAVERLERLPLTTYPAFALLSLARVEGRAGRLPLALDHLSAGCAAAAATRDRDALIEAIETASLLAMPGDPERAALLAGIAGSARIRERLPAHPGQVVRFHRHHPDLRAALGEARLASLWAEGGERSLDAGIELAAARAAAPEIPPAPAPGSAADAGQPPRAAPLAAARGYG
ncbi:MAG: ATP-binding protein [Chloroflexota bacterium]